MKHHHRRRRHASSASEVSEFTEALYGGSSDRLSSDRQAERKTRQFCRQVQRALNLALADRPAEDGLGELFVEEVRPAPDCGHLLVEVVIPPDRRVDEALAALRRDAPRLRTEVAQAITRKRAPELSFAPVFAPAFEPGLGPEAPFESNSLDALDASDMSGDQEGDDDDQI